MRKFLYIFAVLCSLALTGFGQQSTTLLSAREEGGQMYLTYRIQDLNEATVFALERISTLQPVMAPPFEYSTYKVDKEKSTLSVGFPSSAYLTEEVFTGYLNSYIPIYTDLYKENNQGKGTHDGK